MEGPCEKSISRAPSKDESIKNETVTPTNDSITIDGFESCNRPMPISPSPTEVDLSEWVSFNVPKRIVQLRWGWHPIIRKSLCSILTMNQSMRQKTRMIIHPRLKLYQDQSQYLPQVLSHVMLILDALLPSLYPVIQVDRSPPCSPLGRQRRFWTRAFRSLALPSFVEPSPRDEYIESPSILSPARPPELAEIAAIYAEIGVLYEC